MGESSAFPLGVRKRERRNIVREKALKLNRELFWKQTRVKGEWMWMRGLQSGAPVSRSTTKETQAWELCPGIPVTQISLLFYDTRCKEV